MNEAPALELRPKNWMKPAMKRLSVLLCAAALLSPLGGCRREPEFARVDAALAPLIPGDAVAIACLRLDRIKKTRFHEQFIEKRKLPQLERFAEQTGLDVRKDIWELLVAMRPAPAPPLALIRGKFGGAFGLEPEFKQPGLQRMSYKGYYIVYGDGPGVLFLNTGAAAAGRIEDLKALVDRRDQKDWKTNRALLDLAGTLPGTSPFWMAATRGGELLPRIPEDGPLGGAARLTRTLGQMTVHSSLDNGLAVTVRGGYPDDATARQAAQALRGLLGLARLRTPAQDADMLRVLDGIRVTERQTEVEINAEVASDLIEKFLTLLPGQAAE